MGSDYQKRSDVHHAIEDELPFPMSCPACKAAAGLPFMAGTHLENSGINVAVRCGNCAHEWQYDVPVTSERMRDSGIHRVVKT